MSKNSSDSMMENAHIAFFLLMAVKIIGLVRLTLKPEMPISGNEVPQVTLYRLLQFIQDH